MKKMLPASAWSHPPFISAAPRRVARPQCSLPTNGRVSKTQSRLLTPDAYLKRLEQYTEKPWQRGINHVRKVYTEGLPVYS